MSACSSASPTGVGPLDDPRSAAGATPLIHAAPARTPIFNPVAIRARGTREGPGRPARGAESRPAIAEQATTASAPCPDPKGSRFALMDDDQIRGVVKR